MYVLLFIYGKNLMLFAIYVKEDMFLTFILLVKIGYIESVVC